MEWMEMPKFALGADVAGVDRRGAESEESDEGAGIEVSEVRNSMRLFAQSTNGL